MESEPSKHPLLVVVCCYCADKNDIPQRIKIDGQWIDACPLKGVRLSHGMCDVCEPRAYASYGLKYPPESRD